MCKRPPEGGTIATITRGSTSCEASKACTKFRRDVDTACVTADLRDCLPLPQQKETRRSVWGELCRPENCVLGPQRRTKSTRVTHVDFGLPTSKTLRVQIKWCGRGSMMFQRLAYLISACPFLATIWPNLRRYSYLMLRSDEPHLHCTQQFVQRIRVPRVRQSCGEAPLGIRCVFDEGHHLSV